MSRPITSETIVTAIASLTDPAKIATLVGIDACNPRLNKAAYWMHQANVLGLDLNQLIREATSRYDDTEQHRNLVLKSLVKNNRQMVRLGCYTLENLDLLRNGNSATIILGPYVGQKVEVDHVVPKSLIPALAKDFANLRFEPFRINRMKWDRIRHSELRAIRIFAACGLVPSSAVEMVRELADEGLSVRTARSKMPGHAAHLATLPPSAGFGSGATDPQMILARVAQLIERVRDWEPRADSALFTAALIQRHTAEHVARTEALLRQAQSRAEDDVAAARGLEAELSNWFSLGAKNMERAKQCVGYATSVGNRARQASQRWKREVNFANSWQRRAQAWEQNANYEVVRAEEALRRAESALSHAKEALERARNRTRRTGRDSDGKPIYEPIDTTKFENAVSNARERVERCEARLEKANDELQRATAAREAAEARLAACTHAVKLARDAEDAASAALKFARNAMAAVDRASEEHGRADYLTNQARNAASNADQFVIEMAKRSAVAAAHECDAVNALRTGQYHHAAARQQTTLGCMEISWRLEQLRAFDAKINLSAAL